MPLRLLDMVASMSHYEAHLKPIWERIDDDYKGEMRVGEAEALVPPKRNRVMLVAAFRDLAPLRGMGQFIYVEHGSGQAYAGDPKSAHWNDYSASGGDRHTDTIGYICPSEHVAARWAPKRTAVVGCPRLDAYHLQRDWTHDNTVCLNFHWPCLIAPEAGTAYGHYRSSLGHIARWAREQAWEVVAHLHPRWALEDPTIFDDFTAAGIDLVGNDDALHCPVLISDNSSTMYEAASLGRHVVVLNRPEYRRNIHHGLRFWDAVPGLQIDNPDMLLQVQLDKVRDSVLSAEMGAAAAAYAYAFRDGRCAQRAAEAIMSWLD